jgi:galactokinase
VGTDVEAMNGKSNPNAPNLELVARFEKHFGGVPHLVQAPGRVNLIGEHTDYNEGFVFPAAIAFNTQVATGKRNDRSLVVFSENYRERCEFGLDQLPAAPRGHWCDYVIGVVRLLVERVGTLPGANLLIHGDVPHGAGLSSSASLEVAVCLALLDISEEKLEGTAIARLCQQAENEFVGARCGIMDQFVCVHGQKDHALQLDCRSLEYRLFAVPPEVHLVICNTMVRHSLAAGEYNQRREECEAAARYFSERLPGVRALRDVTIENLAELGAQLPERIQKRARHVISEDARVLQAAEALQSKDLARFGKLMADSHASLRDDFEVSSEELDLMVRLAEQSDGVYGARMTGGGFGGCAIALVEADHVERFKTRVSAEYERIAGRAPELYVSSAANGAGRLF